MASRVRVYIASSLDGFIAGPDDDLSWLTGPDAANGKDVYLDGGNLIRQAAEADLIDDLTITMAPVALGAGHPLFAGMAGRYPLEITGHYTYAGGMVQIQARPRDRQART